jgi:CTP:molybdopterin cytidylyltransferase MocA
MRTAAVILAAGSASRFGSPKPFVRIAGRTMLEHVAGTAAAAGLQPVIAVVPAGTAVPSSVIPEINPHPEAGLSRSLQLGLGAVPVEEADGAVILLADQPTLTADTILAVATETTDRPIVAARADGRIGPPVLVRRSAFGLVENVSGDVGLRDVIGANPGLVATVEVGEHAPDIDTPDALDALAPACRGCGERFVPAPIDEMHPYIGSSTGCWAAFGDVVAREFNDTAYGRVHRHTVDVYAAQHPGDNNRRQRQSVALHLIGICHWLEHEVPLERLNALTQRLAAERPDWPWLEPPTRHAMTVADILNARSGEEHVRLVRAWAESLWAAWAPHHDLVRRWAAGALG